MRLLGGLHLKLVVSVVFLTILLSIPRFAHYTPDSRYYLELASFFRGESSKSELDPPYTYRVLVPLLAAYGPSEDLAVNFAAINVMFTILAYFVFYFYLKQLLNDATQTNLGMLILVVSFPTFNYASGVLTDPAGFLLFTLAVYLALTRRWLLSSVAITVGVLAREAVLSLVLGLGLYYLIDILYHQKKVSTMPARLSLALPIAAYLGVRAYFSDLPSYLWLPSWSQFAFNISQLVFWITFLSTLSPPLLLFLIGLLQNRGRLEELLAGWSAHERHLLLSVAVACTVLIFYSVLAAALSGRFVWPFYTVLVPLGALFASRTTVVSRYLTPLSDLLFGDLAARPAGRVNETRPPA